jgi:hypothetical protein
VRFDRFGLYGYKTSSHSNFDSLAVDSTEKLMEDESIRFGLTWEGLLVKGEDGGLAKIGKGDSNNDYIILIKDKDNNDTFRVKKDGSVEATKIKIIKNG